VSAEQLTQRCADKSLTLWVSPDVIAWLKVSNQNLTKASAPARVCFRAASGGCA
jgi:hypothetical protein